MLLSSAPHAGATWACAEATASDLVGRSFWVSVGTDDPDEYATVPGADFQIVPTAGTHTDILAAVRWVGEQDPDPEHPDRPNLLILDSSSPLWDLLTAMAHQEAVQRVTARGRTWLDTDIEIGRDLWQQARDRWDDVIDALRAHPGPVIVTARLEEVPLVDDEGRYTRDRAWRVLAHKSLPGAVGVHVHLPERGKALLVGVKSTRMPFPERTELPDFTVDRLWRDLGLADAEVEPRRHAHVYPADAPADTARAAVLEAAQAAGLTGGDAAQRWARDHDGEDIRQATDVAGLLDLAQQLREPATDTPADEPAEKPEKEATR